MGCCLSNGNLKGPTHRPAALGSGSGRELLPEPESPPPVETVKEVLSETPAKPLQNVALMNSARPLQNVSLLNSDKVKSDHSRVISDSLSLSTATTEKRAASVNQEEVKPVRVEPSPPKYRRKGSFSAELPLRRDQSVDIGCGAGVRREAGSVRGTFSAREAGRVPPAFNGPRRHSGEMKSVSTAVKQRATMQQQGTQGRSLSAPRMVGNSNVKASQPRLPTAAPDCGVRRPKAAGGAEGNESRRPKAAGGAEGNESRRPKAAGGAEGNESLENPLVSMECFIFL